MNAIKKKLLLDAGFQESANYWCDKEGHELRVAELKDIDTFELRNYLDELS